jgi:hypothetical protein
MNSAKPPAVRELLEDLWADADEVVKRGLSDQKKLSRAYTLASRVEEVLALCKEARNPQRGDQPNLLWADDVESLLNGEEL